jgi:hypothetical protein
MRDLSSYNESLVRCGQVLLDFDVIDNWVVDVLEEFVAGLRYPSLKHYQDT